MERCIKCIVCHLNKEQKEMKKKKKTTLEGEKKDEFKDNLGIILHFVSRELMNLISGLAIMRSNLAKHCIMIL